MLPALIPRTSITSFGFSQSSRTFQSSCAASRVAKTIRGSKGKRYLATAIRENKRMKAPLRQAKGCEAGNSHFKRRGQWKTSAAQDDSEDVSHPRDGTGKRRTGRGRRQ